MICSGLLLDSLNPSLAGTTSPTLLKKFFRRVCLCLNPSLAGTTSPTLDLDVEPEVF